MLCYSEKFFEGRKEKRYVVRRRSSNSWKLADFNDSTLMIEQKEECDI